LALLNNEEIIRIFPIEKNHQLSHAPGGAPTLLKIINLKGLLQQPANILGPDFFLIISLTFEVSKFHFLPTLANTKKSHSFLFQIGYIFL
jgi:hypothetical protein